MRNNLFAFAPWSSLFFHHAHWDQTEKSLCPSLGSEPTLAQGPSALSNNLPLSIHPATSVATFIRRIKTYLFDLATPVCPMACWCFEIASTTLYLNTDLAVAPLSLAMPGILPLWKFDWLIDWNDHRSGPWLIGHSSQKLRGRIDPSTGQSDVWTFTVDLPFHLQRTLVAADFNTFPLKIFHTHVLPTFSFNSWEISLTGVLILISLIWTKPYVA